MASAQQTADRLGRLGDHFVLSPVPARRVDDLRDPQVLRGLVERVSGRLGGCEPRVAASIVFLGISARLWAVSLGAAALVGKVLDLDDLGWSDDNGSVALHLPQPRLRSGKLDQLVWEVVVERHVRGLLEVVHQAYPLPRGLLWGNVASGLWGVTAVLDTAPAEAMALRLLDREPLAGAMYHREGRLRRRSCCLFWHVPGGGVCGDCLFDVPPG